MICIIYAEPVSDSLNTVFFNTDNNESGRMAYHLKDANIAICMDCACSITTAHNFRELCQNHMPISKDK